MGGHTEASIKRLPVSWLDDLAMLVAQKRVGPDAADWRTWLTLNAGFAKPPPMESVFPHSVASADDTGDMTKDQLVARARRRGHKKQG